MTLLILRSTKLLYQKTFVLDNHVGYLTSSGTDTKTQSFVPDPAGLEMLVSMGFNSSQATKALKETNNNIERAADWIFSHQGEMDAMEISDDVAGATVSSQQYRDGNSSKFRSK